MTVPPRKFDYSAFIPPELVGAGELRNTAENPPGVGPEVRGPVRCAEVLSWDPDAEGILVARTCPVIVRPGRIRCAEHDKKVPFVFEFVRTVRYPCASCQARPAYDLRRVTSPSSAIRLVTLCERCARELGKEITSR